MYLLFYCNTVKNNPISLRETLTYSATYNRHLTPYSNAFTVTVTYLKNGPSHTSTLCDPCNYELSRLFRACLTRKKITHSTACADSHIASHHAVITARITRVLRTSRCVISLPL